MKKVSDILNNNIINNKEEINLKIFNDKDIVKFIKKNNIPTEVAYNNIQIFYDFYNLKNKIKSNMYKPKLKYSNGIIELEYVETEEKKLFDEANKLFNRIKTEYIPKSILSSNFSNLTTGNSKSKLAKEIIELCDKYLNNTNVNKGLYIYGKTGIGKSYLLGCAYNYLKLNGKEPCIMYFPEFVRKMRANINNGEYINIIDEVRVQEILFIDDIGAENITEFVRDEILVPIINYRASENLLTFFTSNLSISDLGQTLSNTKNKIDETKSIRILDRIKFLSKPVYLEAQNEREIF